MDAVAELVLATIPTVDSQTTYEEVVEAVAPENRHFLPNALKQLKRQGKIQKYIDVVDGQNVHVIKRVSV
jgi:hypothetical protein